MWFARRLLHVLLVVLVLLVGIATAGVIVSETAWFKNRLRVYVLSQAGKYLNGNISIQRLSGNLFHGLELEQIAISVDGHPLLSIKDLGLEYNAFQLITRGLSIDHLRINKPVLYVRHDGDGWSIANLLKKQEREADRRGPQFPLTIEAIGISGGSVVVDDEAGTPGVRIPKQIDRVDAQFSFEYAPVHYSIDVAHVSFRSSDPDLALNSFSGGIAVLDDTVFLESLAVRTSETSVWIDGAVRQYLASPILNLRVTSDKTSIPELAQIVPGLSGIDLRPAFEVALSGPLDRLGVDINARSSAGQLTATLVADLDAPRLSASGDVSIRHLNLAPFVNAPRQASDITADAAIDLQAESFSNLDSLKGTISVDAPRIAAAGYAAERVKATARVLGRRVNVNAGGFSYGASATASGHLVLPAGKASLAFDLRGQIRHLDVKRLPPSLAPPPAATDLNADYHVAGTIRLLGSGRAARPRLTLAATLGDSTVPGAHIESGSTLNLDMRAAEIGYSADAVVTGLDVQRVGDAFRIGALSDDRYKSRIDGHVIINGRGTTLNAMEGSASGTIVDASFLGGRLSQTTFEASFAGDTAQVKAVGTFAECDPAVLSGRSEIGGVTSGRLDVDGRVERLSSGVTLDNLSGTVRLALEPSVVGGVAVERGDLDADYRERTGDIRQLEIVGPNVNVTAHGSLALGDLGQSDLVFHADSPRLGEIGALLGVPLTGLGQVEGRISGNRAELQASGTFVGDGLTYQDTEALTLKSNYSVRVPDLTFSRAAVDADSRATFVKIAGQEVNELAAKTSYDDRHLSFDATAKQPARSLDAAGSLILHPDHQEVHLDRLTIATANQQWSIPPGGRPTINYAQDTIAVEDLRLVSGDQEIAADGQFGRPGVSLHVTARNVDLARVDELLLRSPQFSGTLNANADVEGTRDLPIVEGELQVAHGAFRQFTYDSLGGTLTYEPQGVTIDARLQQNAAQWITAKGFVPTAIFVRTATPEPPDERAGHIEPSDPTGVVDVTIDSSPLGLGLIQGFTTELSHVDGTVEVHVRLAGAAEDPHPSGTLTIADGIMTVASTGVTYSNIAGRVDLEPDRVHIDQLTVLDNHQSALSLTGDLAVHEREVGGFRLWITAEDFEIIDNKMGNLRVNSAMEIAGELRAPEIRGDFGVSTGRINLDEIIALAGPSPYSTEPIDYAGTRAKEGGGRGPSVSDALRMNVRVTVPDDLAVAATSLQTPGAAIGVGAVNVTLGGDLTAAKETSGRVRLQGAVSTVRGTYEFQGRRFEILRDGSVRFDGLEEINPRLDLRTRRMVQGVEARVHIRGTVQKPEVVLDSTPPMEAADILALVVFNQPINQLGVGQQMSLARRAQDLAAGAVTGQLSQSVARALNLETFELDLAPENGVASALTVGQQLGPNLYVKVQQGIADRASTNLIVEYAITNWLRLQTNVLQGAAAQQSLFQRNQGSGADLIFLFTK